MAALYKAMAGLCRKGEPMALAVLVAAYSRVRLGEVRALRGSDVDTRRRLWTWHDLRHVFASHYLWDLGASPADVSTAAGHSTVDIALRIYSTRQAGALDRLGASG